MSAHGTSRLLRFGLFEADPKSGELRKSGLKIHLQAQPFAVLCRLLEEPGEVVTLEDLRHHLWGDQFIDDHGLPRAVNKLRDALGDSADNPRFIETLPKKGYRFIAPVQGNTRASSENGKARSLAVLPLTNASTNPELECVCDGIAEALICSAAQTSGLRVMASGTVFRYKESKMDAQRIGKELRVDTVFAGRVREHGGKLVVNVELVDVQDGAMIWGEQYMRSASDILPMQQEIAAEIFAKLRLTLSREDMLRVTRGQTANPEAYSEYIKGRFALSRRTLDGFKRAIQHFERAVELDPNYAYGHAGIADYYVLLSIFPYSFIPPAEAMPRAKAASLRALEIDAGSAEAHTTLAMIEFCYERNYREAEKNFRRAIELKPGYVTAHQWYTLLLSAMSRFPEAEVEAQKSFEVDPSSGIGSTLAAVPMYFNRQNHRAIEYLRNSVLIEPVNFIPHLFLGYALCAAEEYERAIESFKTACKMSGDNLTALARLGFAYGIAGEAKEAVSILQTIEHQAKSRFVPAHHFAFLHMGLGQKDLASAALERALREHSDYLVYLNVDPPFDLLRNDPRFADLLGRLNFPAKVLHTAAS